MASIKKRPNGSWRARYRDDAGKEHARHFKYKDNPNDPANSAQHWLNEVAAATLTGQYIDPRAGKTTLESFYKEWADRQLWTDGTRRSADQALTSCTFKAQELRKIRRSHVEEWVKKLSADGLQPSTIRTRFSKVRTVLRAAVLDRLIAVDPTAGVKLPRMVRNDQAMRIPTAAEIGRLSASDVTGAKLLVAVCAFAGLRRGEAAALRFTDFDFLGRSLRVARQTRQAAGKREVAPPKYGSERVVYVPQRLLEIVNEHAANGTFGEEGYLFPVYTPGPPAHATLTNIWNDATKAAKVKGVRLHDLRHYYASGLIADGCDVVTVQKALGHAKATTTLNTYSHLWPTAEDKTRKAAENLISEALDGKTVADNLRTTEVRI